MLSPYLRHPLPVRLHHNSASGQRIDGECDTRKEGKSGTRPGRLQNIHRHDVRHIQFGWIAVLDRYRHELHRHQSAEGPDLFLRHFCLRQCGQRKRAVCGSQQEPLLAAAETASQLRSQSCVSLRRTPRVRLSRLIPCGLVGRQFEPPLS